MSVPPVTDAEVYAHSEQQLIEVIYIKTANKILGDTMEKLYSSITHINQIMSILNQLQQQKNNLSVDSKDGLDLDGVNEGEYEDVASEYFGSPVVPELGDIDEDKIEDLKDALQDAIDALKDELAPDDPARNDPTGVIGAAQKVIDTIDDVGASDWVFDNYDKSKATGAAKSGSYQIDLTTAITATQSISDSKKQQVQSALFVFEEYYKSAASILNSITQIMQDIARNIAKG